MIDLQRIGQWGVAVNALGKTLKQYGKAADVAVLRCAVDLEKVIKRGLRDQAPGGGNRIFYPLAQSTLRMRRWRGFRGTKALIVSGDLLRSIRAVRHGRDVFVGVSRSERTRDGKEMVNIAAVHEYGSRAPRLVLVTPKMRKFFMAAFLAGARDAPLKATTRTVIVYTPKRPYMEPGWDLWRETAGKRFAEYLEKELQ